MVTASPQSIAQCMQHIVCCLQDQFVCCSSSTTPVCCGVKFTAPSFQVQFVYHLATSWYLSQFCDHFACQLAHASLQNVMHFVSCTILLFRDQFAFQLATALPPEHSALHITHSILFSGSVCRPFRHRLTPKRCALYYHILYPVFWTNLIASWPLPRHRTLCTSYHTLHCFQDLLAGCLATALPQNIVHFILYTVPLFQDQFVGQFAAA